MKKALTILLAAGLLTGALAGMAGAAGDENSTVQSPPYYLSVTGTVVDKEVSENGTYIEIEDNNGNPAVLVINDRTVFPFDSEFATGSVVTGYYLSSAPMILIWPAQYNIAVLAVGAPPDVNITVDRFYAVEGEEGLMLSKGGGLAFRIGDDTEIILANGDDFKDGNIEGRRMIAIYGPSTKSIPAYATAIKVIVLYEDPTTGPEPIPEDMDFNGRVDTSGWPVYIDGKLIEAPAVFDNEDGIVMVPLRAVAEALGYKVTWDAVLGGVRLGVAIHLWPGSTEVHVSKMAPINISAAPVVIGNTTYVPLEFFRKVLEVTDAFAFEGRIDILTVGEPMEG